MHECTNCSCHAARLSIRTASPLHAFTFPLVYLCQRDEAVQSLLSSLLQMAHTLCLLSVCTRTTQGDFYHWVPLLNRFEDFFTEYIKPRQDLQLQDAARWPADPPFPVQACLQVLRVTSVLLENCSNKHVYASYEVGGQGAGRVERLKVERLKGGGANHPARAVCLALPSSGKLFTLDL